jgi:polysaccharide biosynthesis/export protein
MSPRPCRGPCRAGRIWKGARSRRLTIARKAGIDVYSSGSTGPHTRIDRVIFLSLTSAPCIPTFAPESSYAILLAGSFCLSTVPTVRLQSIRLSAESAAGSIRRVFVCATFFALSVLALHAQPPVVVVPGEGPRYPGTTGDPAAYDTTAVKAGRERTMESSALLEQPIDATQYKLGPGDQLTVSIPTAVYSQFDIPISPDAKVIIPKVGEVNLRGKTLAEGEQAIRDAVARVFKTGGVSVSLRKIRQFKVSLIGAVIYPGTVTATPATRVSEVIDLGGGASPRASKRHITIHRQGRVIPVDLMPFYASGDMNSNPFVEGGDVIRVGVQDPKNVITSYGALQRPGEFSFREGDSISSLIRFSMGFTADAYFDSIQVVGVNERGDTLSIENYQALPDGTIVGDRPLNRGDRIFVRRMQNYRNTDQVVVAGEMRYPGTYPIEPGRTRLRDVIQSAGGFTARASVADAVVIRRAVLKERDTKYELIMQIDPEKRTPEDISYLRVKSTERPGVMTVNIPELMSGRESENIYLADEDSIYVPVQKDFIKVTGKVKNAGNVTFDQGESYEHYLGLAGGYGWRADEDETRIIKGKSGDTFLASSESNYQLEPGDTIFVPEEPEGTFWEDFTSVVTVIAQIGTIVAVILSIRSSVGQQ